MKPPNSKTKLLIIFPRYQADDATHYPYWYRVFDEAGKEMDITLLFESGSVDKTRLKTEFKHIPQIVIQKYQRKPFNLIERAWLVLRLVPKGYTNIYIHYSYWSVLLAWLIKHSSFKSNITIYYWDCEKYEQKSQNKLLELSLKACDVLVTGHEVIGQAYREAFGFAKPIKIVPNWVEKVKSSGFGVRGSGLESQTIKKPIPQSVGSFALRTPHSTRINILFVHHLSPRKGSRELPEIIHLTLEKIPQAHFHIVGEGPDRQELEFGVRSSEFRDRVTFYGKLPLAQVADLFTSVDYFIMPSRAEGFPRVILEAMTYKVPFVATDVGNVREIVSQPQRAYLVPPQEPKHFVQALLALLADPRKKELVDQNNQQAQKYSLSSVVSSFVRIYQL